MNNPADNDLNPDVPDIVIASLSDREIQHQLIAQKLADAQTPGFHAEFDPEEAQLLGAFIEDALNEIEAQDSSIDLSESTDGGQ